MESAVAEFDYQNPIFNDDDIDLDSILQGFPEDFTVDLDLDLDQWLSNSPKEPENPPSVEEMEKFLMEDGDNEKARVEYGDNVVEEFFSGLLVDGSGSDNGRSEVASPESDGSVDSAAAAEEEEEEKREDEVVVIDGDEREEDEESRKKRRRYF